MNPITNKNIKRAEPKSQVEKSAEIAVSPKETEHAPEDSGKGKVSAERTAKVAREKLNEAEELGVKLLLEEKYSAAEVQLALALEAARKCNEGSGERAANLSAMLAVAYAQRGDVGRAVEALEVGKSVSKKPDSNFRLGLAEALIGVRRGDAGAAPRLEDVCKNDSFATDALDAQWLKANAHHWLADAYLEVGDTTKADAEFKTAVDIADSAGFNGVQAASLAGQAEILLKAGKLKEAEHLARAAVDLVVPDPNNTTYFSQNETNLESASIAEATLARVLIAMGGFDQVEEAKTRLVNASRHAVQNGSYENGQHIGRTISDTKKQQIDAMDNVGQQLPAQQPTSLDQYPFWKDLTPAQQKILIDSKVDPNTPEGKQLVAQMLYDNYKQNIEFLSNMEKKHAEMMQALIANFR